MKKLAIFLFAVATAVVMNTGTAHADRSFWFHNTGANWATYFNIVNVDTTNIVTATVTFTDVYANRTLGSTTKALEAGQMWNFSTLAAGATGLTTTAFETNVRGAVKITGSTAGKILGWGSVFDSGKSGGFNFRITGSEAMGNSGTGE